MKEKSMSKGKIEEKKHKEFRDQQRTSKKHKNLKKPFQ